MYQLLGHDGDEFCIIDHDTLTIQTVSTEGLWDLIVYEGAQIRGLSREDADFSRQKRTLSSSQCNWLGGDNIFLNAKRFVVGENGQFSLISGSRAFNGVVEDGAPYAKFFVFDFGVRVPVWHKDYDTLLSGDVKSVITTLGMMAQEVDFDDSIIEAYNRAKATGNEAEVSVIVRHLVYAGRWPLD